MRKEGFGQAFRKQGITGVTPHGLRKKFCSQLARYKVHPKVAQTLMGHSNVSLTIKIYTEIDQDQLREAMNILPTTHQMKQSELHLMQGEKSPSGRIMDTVLNILMIKFANRI